MSINRVNISGNLTRDPELRSTASGTPVLMLGIAVNDRRKNNQTGEWEDSPNFIDCTMFGTRALSISRFLSKGNKVAIEGKLRWSQWEQKDGSKRSKIDVIIDEIEFMSARENTGQVVPQYTPNGTPQVTQAPATKTPQVTQTPSTAIPQVTQKVAPQEAANIPMVTPAQQQMPGMPVVQPRSVYDELYDEDIPF